ncbi:MAG: hypothetical protein A2784_00555 [Candidatus Chisholmbacteria bacterium RIFCSPHIGHO2_01_FULL_48_12]|uniref:Uncharacterized protein n=1 Tax=Candidatus Chisholmbacteria bacterium RIFCSPHIGHO2_01_FULL_48_12 TaxID=1797589 RepID=A0A1G1VQC1_9BACT|nr:MAG: hypothetical protein A2784_00555 [Candidatus Chisholmbacteria bacterium RIFCSPHIGHO2_01_FULL_48_12]
MNNFFEKLEDDLAYSKVGRGEGTGPVSRILSGINMLLLVLLIVTLLKNNFYLPAVLLLTLGFTRFAHWVSIGLLVYLVLLQFWPGVTIMVIYSVIGWASVMYGVRNVKRNFHSNKAKVDPFEGMSDLLFVLIFQILFFAIALITSGLLSVIFWMLFAIVTFFEIVRYYNRLASPWRQLHYPLMVRYAAFAGMQTGIAERENREFDIKEALREFVKNIYPNWSRNEVEDFLKPADNKKEEFVDRGNLIKAYQKNDPSFDIKKLSEVLEKIHIRLKKEGPRWVIAEIIERDYGTSEKIKYLQAMISGDAN